jgi:endonuclease G
MWSWGSIPKKIIMPRIVFRFFFSLFFVGLLVASAGAQNSPAFEQAQLDGLLAELGRIRQQEKALLEKIEALKLLKLRNDLDRFGLPALEEGEEVIHHTAFSLVYAEEHEQAKWVAHVITPDVLTGNVDRTNDFREDPKVATGSAVEADYFLKYEQEDGTFEYDGYGYDRGHLAPSADFRWSEKALSESYYYSNMSPQAPEFNRGKWAELEGLIRGYLTRHPTSQLYVVTGPVLKGDLSKVERSVNGLSLPKLYYKVVLDRQLQRGIGFILPNQEIQYPLQSFAVSIDKVEEETGIDFFPALEDIVERQVEGQSDVMPWLPPGEQDDVIPIYAPSLPAGHFNTVQAALHADKGREVIVCGTVVSAKKSRKGNVFLNLDKKFPNQIFSITIWKDNLVNFSYAPEETWVGKQICVKGEVRLFNGTPTVNVSQEEQLTLYEP